MRLLKALFGGKDKDTDDHTSAIPKDGEPRDVRPNDAESHYIRGVADLEAGHLDNAIAELSKVVDNDSGFGSGKARFKLGVAYERQGLHDRAIRELEASAAMEYEPARELLDSLKDPVPPEQADSDQEAKPNRQPVPERTWEDTGETPRRLLHDRFEVIDVLTGGMGVVYLCLDQQAGQPVALKTFKPEFLPDRDARDRFLREATTWVNLGQHPHIVRCYQVFSPQVGPEVYLSLEWIVHHEDKRGASLREWLVPGQPLPHEEALLFGLHIARGMKHAVKKIPELVHRDLKPENVLVGRDELARVTDFGLASTLANLAVPSPSIGTGSGALRRTQLTHGIVGTPLYMAPEQWRGDSALDARADIYALGCILYEMITGAMIVSGNSIQELRQAHITGRLNGIPQELFATTRTLLRRCLSLRREDRYANWEEVESAVMAAYSGVTGTKAPDELTTEKERRPERIMVGYSYNVIGNSYHELGKYDTAKRYFEKARQIGQNEGHSRLEGAGLLGLGVVRANLGDVRTAIEYYETALANLQENTLGSISALMSMANAYRDLGETQQALGLYDQALTSAREIGARPREGGILTSLGNLHRRLGRVQKAIELYEQALAVTEQTGDRARRGTDLGNLGIAHRSLGQPEKAIRFQQQSLDIARATGDRAGEGRALNNLGRAFMDLGETREAVQFFERALSISREANMRRLESTILLNLGECCRRLEDIDTAIDFSTQALAIAQETGDALGAAKTNLSLAYSLSDQLQWQAALDYAQRAARLFEQLGHVEALHAAQQLLEEIRGAGKVAEHCERGVLYADQGRSNAAAFELQAALRINPDYALAHYNLGTVYANQGLLDKAIAEFQATVRLIPNVAKAHYNLGTVYERKGQTDEAIRAWQAGLRISPNDTELRFILGFTFLTEGRLQEAIREFQAALHINPEDAAVHYQLGRCYWQQERMHMAKRAWQSALRVNPSYANAHHSLGLVYAKQGHLEEAASEFQAALRINPDFVEAHYDLGGAYSLQGHWRQARSHYEAVLQARPDDADAHYRLGVTYYNQDRLPEALNELQTAAQLGAQSAWKLLAHLGLI